MGLIGAIGRTWRAWKLGVAFLTVIPVRFREGEVTGADLGASRFAYPAVGATVGLALAGLSGILGRLGAARELAAFLIVAAGAALTGGLHLDGLADSADGLFLWGDKARRLDAMKDPHVGSYGLTAVVLVVLGKFAILCGLTGPFRHEAVFLAAMIGRTIVLVSAGLAGYARPQGTGRILVNATRLPDALGAALLALLVGFALGGPTGLIAGGLAVAWAFGMTRLATARLGGVTGDTLGALVETGELVVLMTLGLLV